MPPALSQFGSNLAKFGMGVAHDLGNTASDVVNPLVHLPQAAYNEGKMIPAALTGNQVALQHALAQARSQNAQGSGFVTTPGIAQQVSTPGSQFNVGQVGMHSLGHSLNDIMNLASLMPAGRAGMAVAENPIVRSSLMDQSGYIRNLGSGQFSKTAVDPQDAQIMAAFIDHARGISNLEPQDAYMLERDAANIAEHYNIGGAQRGGGNPLLRLANGFDRVLSGSPQALNSGMTSFVRNNGLVGGQ